METLDKPERIGSYDPLPTDTNLRRRYTLKRVIGSGAHGITYEAMDYRAGQQVVVKEYFPRELAVRASGTVAVSPKDRASGALFFLGSEMFLRQHSALMQAIGNPNLVSVFDVFFENGTVYAVMEKLGGVTPMGYVRLKGRLIDRGELMRILLSVADALLVVHSLNILHHDITDESILLCTDGTVKLIDFGAARRTLMLRREPDDSLTFADICAVGRALYPAFVGKPVPTDRQQLMQALPPDLAALFEGMLSADPQRRFDTVFAFRHALGGMDIAPEQLAVTEADVRALDRDMQAAAHERNRAERPQPHVPAHAAEGKQKRRILLFYGGVVAAALIVALILRFFVL